jgi:hypothetical protein
MQLGLIAPAICVDFRRPQVAATDFVHVRLILIHPPVVHTPTPLWKSYGSSSSYTSKLPKFSDTKELANVRILNPEIYIPPGSGNLKAKGAFRQRTHHWQYAGSSRGSRGHLRAFG